MRRTSETSAPYAIRVAGHLGRISLAALPEMSSQMSCEGAGATTVLSGEVKDPSSLYGILARLEALGLEIIDLRRGDLGPPD
jgi:hypothetical protein